MSEWRATKALKGRPIIAQGKAERRPGFACPHESQVLKGRYNRCSRGEPDSRPDCFALTGLEMAWADERMPFAMPQRGIGPKPRVGATRLPWEGGLIIHQPQRGCGLDAARRPICRNPVGVVFNLRPLPRVARSSQPWAGGHSPVGAGKGSAG